MARPVLGIICCNRHVGVEPAQVVMERYVRSAMTHADVAALLVPSLPDLMSAAEVAPRLDGILLTGSPSNVESHRYGDGEGSGPYDPGRDEIALSLVEAMAERRKPVFGICRGFQEINVALGGTLRRDTSENDELIRHHAPAGADFDAMFDHKHRVFLKGGGMLAAAFRKPELHVNSVHYQGIGQLAPGLRVEATAPDGLVEAYSADLQGAPLLAVQWHPEWDASDPDSQTFFHLLGRALRGEPLTAKEHAA
ncbi:gamma-glutamyl-gamma-aminobutyrate hydrolase family protein [Sphingomonas arenae]|uniref:gamma-glutamyl-gamma-aminobutyrate hydrolase family protein n=1 Tax=Sphingomonas arenae TaxID=2812555 RepID=UPI0019684733|nr:gamma-glutamyl-gamma-aminobutyrate hydrolase family protein [Sphingomonas arenae]